MSEHAWVQENLASYFAGGLDAGEGERLEQHLAECSSCAQAAEELRAIDHSLADLFAAVQPASSLEDQLIQSLRAAPMRSRLPFLKFAQGGLAAAAVLMIAFLGTVLNGVIERGNLLFPGSEQGRLLALNNEGLQR